MSLKFYERYWAADKDWSPSEGPFSPFEQRLLESVGKPGDTCLDYGCGDGKRYGKQLQDLGFDYRGFDISQTAVQQALNLGVNAAVLNPDGTTNLPANSCDFAICFEVFEHLMEPQESLSEIVRVLKPGGHLICSVPNAACFPRRIEFLLTGFLNPKGNPTTERSAPWQDPHIRFFSCGMLKQFLASQHLTNITVAGSPFTLDFLLPFARSAPRLERPIRWLANSPGWLSHISPGWFGRRFLAIAVKPLPEGPN